MTSFLLGLYFNIFQEEHKANTVNYSFIEAYNKQEDYKDKEIKCLVKTLWFESNGEGFRGSQLVAEVVVNRTKSKGFPNTVCGVVSERGSFSFYSPSKMKKKVPSLWYRQAYKIAQKAIQEESRALPDNVYWFKRCDVQNNFFDTRKLHSKYKNHCYYR